MDPQIIAILAFLVLLLVTSAIARQVAWAGFVNAYENRYGRRPGWRQLVGSGLPMKAILRADEDAEIERLRRRYWAISALVFLAFGALVITLFISVATSR